MTLAAVPTALAPGLADEGPRLRELGRIAAYLGRDRNLVRGYLLATLADPYRMAVVAQRSYRHVNGFAKIRIVEGKRYSARLHVWSQGPDVRGDVDPHGHRWEFASWVVAGAGVAERIYAAAVPGEPDARSFVRLDYRRPSEEGRLVPTGQRSWLRQIQNRRLGLGEINLCGLDVVHTVEPVGSGLVATVLLQGHDRAESTTVFRVNERDHGPLEVRLRVDELERLFVDVLQVMGERM